MSEQQIAEEALQNRINAFKYVVPRLVKTIEGNKLFSKGSTKRREFIRLLIIYTRNDNPLEDYYYLLNNQEFLWSSWNLKKFNSYLNSFESQEDKNLVYCIYQVFTKNIKFEYYDDTNITRDDLIEQLNLKEKILGI